MKKSIITFWVLAFSFAVVAAQGNPETFEKKSKYNFAQSVEKIKEAALEAGWTIPKEFDMQASMKKAGHEVLPVRILVLCHSGHAYQMLGNDETRKLTSIMPCRAGIYEKSDGSVYISWSNYAKMGERFGEPAQTILAEVAKEMKEIAESVAK